MKNTVHGTNTVCHSNVNKTPGYNNVPFPIYGSPLLWTVESTIMYLNWHNNAGSIEF